ncbi:MAG: MarR family transcriptional regulator [Gemmatimonadaceae bacterium]
MTQHSTLNEVPTLEILRLLWRVNHAMERRSKHMHATLGITAPQRMVIRFVGRTPGISAGELAKTLHVDPGTLSSALGALEREKLLSRKSDASDGRRVRIFLTARGRRLDTDTPRTVEAAVHTAMARHSKRSLSIVRSALESLAQELGDFGDAISTP